MVGVPSVPRSRRAGVLALFALLLPAAPATAADERDPSAGVVLARGGLNASIVADLDGDGGNEVIAVIGPPDGIGQLVVQAWAEGEAGWSSLGRVPLELWDEGGDRSRPATNDDTASVMRVKTRAGERVIVPVATLNSDGFGGCCLSFTELSLVGDSLRAELMPRLPDAMGVESLVAMDFEADGVDELIVIEYISVAEPEGNEPRYSVLRQASSGWRREALPIEDDRVMWLSTFGETDGVAGTDLIMVDSETNGLTRVFSDGTTLRAERAPENTLIGPDGGWIAAAAAGVLVLSDERGIATAEWSRGGVPTRLLSADSGAYPTIFMLGDGLDARIVQLSDNGMNRNVPLGVRIYDLDLELLQSYEADPVVQQLWDLSVSDTASVGEIANRLWPQFGPLPTGLNGRPAMLGAGALISLSSSGAIDVRPTRPILGSNPVGVAGRGSDWVVSGPGWFGQPSSVSLYGGGTPDSFLSVLPLDTLLDVGAGPDEWSLQGATRLDVDGEEVLATGGDGFTVTIGGEPGTLVVTSVGTRVGATEIVEGPVSVPIDPRGREDDENDRIEATIVIIEPTGVTTSTTWQVDVYRQPPEVTAFTESELFSLRSTVRGRVSDGTSVTVDGRPVDLNANGAFHVEVDAPIWPRDVLVVGRDPLGNESVQHLEVIGFVDYRGLPWIPIVGTMTVMAGLVLFVRTPRLRRDERLLPDGDGRLEEIDGDLI